MKNISKTAVLCVIALVAATLSACQSTSQMAGTPTGAVVCDKCQTVWVTHPSPAAGGKYTVMTKSKAMKCPECENAVVTFMKTGQLKHHCEHCGGTPYHCVLH